MELAVVVTRIYLDANIFISTFERNDEQSRLLLDLISVDRRGKKPFLATSELTLAELLVDPYRNANDRLVRIYENLTLSNAFIEVGPVSRDVLWHAAVLRAEYSSLRLPDAIHVSTAMHFRCSHILTSDRGLKGSYLVAQRRHGISGPAVSVATLRPDVPTLNVILQELAK